MKRKEVKAIDNPYAPIFIRQIADSMIVMAAALLIVGVDLKDYFKPDDHNQKAAEIIEKYRKEIKTLNERLIIVEELAHKGEKKHAT